MRRDPSGIDRLESCGTRPAPPLDDEATARIELRLRALMSETDQPASTEAPTTLRLPTVGGRIRSGAAIAAAAAALLLALVIADPGVAELELLAARGVTIEYPDGSTGVARPGDVLADGTVLRVDTDGSAIIGTTRLGPGDVVEIVDGRMVIVNRSRTVDDTTDPQERRPPTTRVASGTSVPDPRGIVGSPRPLEDRVPARPASGSPAVPPVRTPQPPSTTGTTAPSTTTAPPPSSEPHRSSTTTAPRRTSTTTTTTGRER